MARSNERHANNNQGAILRKLENLSVVVPSKYQQCVACGFLLGLLAACGGGGGGGGGSSGGAVDNTAPSVASATPASGSSSVSRIADLRVTLSEAINVATLAAANVQIAGANIEGSDGKVGVRVNYDAATTTVVINPNQPLLPNSTYTLTLANIEDGAGNKLPITMISFRTYINPTLRQVFYSAGNIASYSDRTYDGNGNQTRVMLYSGVGADAVWFTADDVVGEYSQTTYVGNGKPQRSTRFAANGMVLGYDDTTYDTTGNIARQISFSGAGADTTWFSADDAAAQRSDYRYD